MSVLFQVLRDSFIITSKNFTLVYIFLFLILLFQFIFAISGASKPGFELNAVSLGCLLLFAAIMAGWFAMVAKACIDFYKAQGTSTNQFTPSPRAEILAPFRLFQAFLPGVGCYFIPVSIAYVFQLLLGIAWWNWFQPILNRGLPLLMKVVEHPNVNQETLLKSFSTAQLAILNEFSLSVLLTGLLLAVLSLLFRLWPVFIVLYGKRPWSAYFSSLLQFFKDPVMLLGLFLVTLTIRLPFMLVSATVSAQGGFFLITAMLQLLGFLLEVFFTTTLFSYALKRVGDVNHEFFTAESATSSTDANNPPQSGNFPD